MATRIFTVTLQCFLDNVGNDVGGESEVKTTASIGPRNKTVGPVDLPINQRLNPPLKLVEFSSSLQGSESLKVNIVEVDDLLNPDDPIIAWRWRPSQLDSLAVNQSTGPIRYNFGFGRENPTQEPGFEGFVIVNATRVN